MDNIVYFQTTDKKIWCAELIEQYDDGSTLVKILVDGDGNKIKNSEYSLVTSFKRSK